MTKLSRSRWLIIPAVLAGAAVFVWLVKNRAEPERVEYQETARVVRTIVPPVLTVVPRYLGNGNVAPSQVWNGVAQVAGTVIAVDPRFNKGAVVAAGQFLLQIDPSDYELAMTQVDTELEATRARLAEIDVQEANSKASLAIEQQALEISIAERERKRTLLARGTLSSSEFEREQRTVLAQRQSVQAQENVINLYPVERRRLNAELARFEAQLAAARLDLERTTVAMPFTGRIARVDAEQFQFVRQGDRLGVADGIDRAEIEVQVPMGRVAALIRAAGSPEVDVVQTDDLGEVLGITVRVFLQRDALSAEWSGRVARFSDTLDPRTRTVGVIVEVEQPYADVRPGIKPPLLKGMFVNVELSGRPRADNLVIPRTSLYGNEVYVVDTDNRLARRVVEIGITGTGYYSVTRGLGPGDRLVVSDLVPAIDGMLLEPLDDPELLERLIVLASGAAR